MSINRTLTEEMIARNITTRQEITLYINKTNVFPGSPIGAILKIAGSYEARDAIVSNYYNVVIISNFSMIMES